MSNVVEFIKSAGGCIVSRNVLEKKGMLKWCVREKSMNKIDNGWRFFSDIDTDEYLSNPNNMCVCDFNTVANIEPAILAIYNAEVGTDLELQIENNKKRFIDNNTGKEFKI
ncbi:DUF2185 domain-containing protein [Pseudobutyrivibrio xylanivorans]|uniref:DUF2185 domain-containing protein n=1 Tax=Pseudobutyrivibrio xylanivorans TaxID=185007 RepID=A0A5P6VPR9_PSEXY|nr:DUF2185 domain-containing protein [Pseudobutyrivibrio xylanivorans]QFJ54666.1 DUF2185 domain-containing protein [Pseudobutyrivibrio xylanivorans]